jgi:hypothetical protein
MQTAREGWYAAIREESMPFDVERLGVVMEADPTDLDAEAVA